jgi:predicted glycoside hydrolase/deacetylase ChbG (UPF0249 family)
MIEKLLEEVKKEYDRENPFLKKENMENMREEFKNNFYNNMIAFRLVYQITTDEKRKLLDDMLDVTCHHLVDAFMESYTALFESVFKIALAKDGVRDQ